MKNSAKTDGANSYSVPLKKSLARLACFHQSVYMLQGEAESTVQATVWSHLTESLPVASVVLVIDPITICLFPMKGNLENCRGLVIKPNQVFRYTTFKVFPE